MQLFYCCGIYYALLTYRESVRSHTIDMLPINTIMYHLSHTASIVIMYATSLSSSVYLYAFYLHVDMIFFLQQMRNQIFFNYFIPVVHINLYFIICATITRQNFVLNFVIRTTTNFYMSYIFLHMLKMSLLVILINFLVYMHCQMSRIFYLLKIWALYWILNVKR